MPTRRSLLKTFSAPAILPGAALGLNGAVAPSERIALAVIGTNWMGMGHVEEFLKVRDARIVAVCDIDNAHLSRAKAMVDSTYGDQGCSACRAFEEVLGRNDIDGVTIAVPDHWHAIIAVMAARAKKDVYCEKPLAYSFDEGLKMVRAKQAANIVWQTGSWQRSIPNFRQACEIVRNGAIGKVHTVEVGLPGGHSDFDKLGHLRQPTAPPASLWYDRWLGPAPEAPYCPARVHKTWRWNYDYAGGQLMDWVGHHMDIAHWGMNWDHTGPLEISGEGEMPPRDALWNTATRYRITMKYPGGVDVVMAGGYKEIAGGTKWIGPDGWVWVTRGRIDANPKSLLEWTPKAGDVRLPQSPGHYQEFADSIKSRKPTLTPAEVGFRSATPGWLANIAMFTGRKLRWDPEKLEIAGDAGASKMLGREMRSPWRL